MISILTIEQKDILIGKTYDGVCYFNPIQDLNDNWIISIEEMEQCVNSDFLWVNDLDLIPYEPKPTPPIE